MSVISLNLAKITISKDLLRFLERFLVNFLYKNLPFSTDIPQSEQHQCILLLDFRLMNQFRPTFRHLVYNKNIICAEIKLFKKC
jgi:hypothetical protein